MLDTVQYDKFLGLAREHKFTRDSFERIKHRFDLDKVDLEKEYIEISKKQSYLSARQRIVVGELLQLNEILEKVEAEDNEKASQPVSGVIPSGAVETEKTE